MMQSYQGIWQVTYKEAFVSASLTSSFATLPVSLNGADGIAIQIPITGSVSGSFVVQGSVDAGPKWLPSSPATGSNRPNDIVNWTSIVTASYIPAANNPVVGFNLADQHWRWLRIVYTPYLNGSGTLFQINSNTKLRS